MLRLTFLTHVAQRDLVTFGDLRPASDVSCCAVHHRQLLRRSEHDGQPQRYALNWRRCSASSHWIDIHHEECNGISGDIGKPA